MTTCVINTFESGTVTSYSINHGSTWFRSTRQVDEARLRHAVPQPVIEIETAALSKAA
jgi:hypothetical protein